MKRPVDGRYPVVICTIDGSLADVPDWLQDKIVAEREVEALFGVSKKPPELASLAEVAAYCMSASFTAPLDYHAGQVYLYAATKVMEERGRKVPDEIRVTKLGPDEEWLLAELRRGIYRKRGPARTMLSEAMRGVFGDHKRAKKARPAEVMSNDGEQVRLPSLIPVRLDLRMEDNFIELPKNKTIIQEQEEAL